MEPKDVIYSTISSRRESDNLSGQTYWCIILLEKVATGHSFGRLYCSVLGVTVCLSHYPQTVESALHSSYLLATGQIQSCPLFRLLGVCG